MTIRLNLVLHFHQPVGNFDHVFQDAVDRCYAPIITHFERHPGVQAALHLSGCLLEWLETHQSSLIDRIVKLIDAGQVEPLGGGFYEPILTVIPRTDALEQLVRLKEYWIKRAGVAPIGAWLPERVWEPSLAELLCEAGLKYTVLDDQHLRFSGLLADRLSGFYVTERSGRALGFFPSDYKLRYLIPFRPMENVKEHFRALYEEDSNMIITYGDDAEKFGLWPGTNQWVFAEKWLEHFFSYLEDSGSPVRAVRPIDVLKDRPAAKNVYVPNASYPEMLEWALPPDSVAQYAKTRAAAMAGAPEEAVKAFVRGSLWDMFLARYPESNQMLKHVLRTGRRVREMNASTSQEALYTSVLRAECNCAYWHGLFGGVYLPHLRHGVYTSVLEADATLNERLGSEVRVEQEDYDGDFEDEVILSSREIQAFFRPSDGGTLVELDYLPARFNVTNVVSRWKESYHIGEEMRHDQGSGSGGVSSPHESAVGISHAELAESVFDSIPLRSLRDFYSQDSFSPEQLARFDKMELGKGRLSEWKRNVDGWSARHHLADIIYQRQVRLTDPHTMLVEWTVETSKRTGGFFGTLFFLSLLTGDATDRHAEISSNKECLWTGRPGDRIQKEDARCLLWRDEPFGFSIDLSSPQPVQITATPIQTLQRSEKGYESVYQGTLIALAWPLEWLRDKVTPLQLKVSFQRNGR